MSPALATGSPMLRRILDDARDEPRLDALRRRAGLPPPAVPAARAARLLAEAIGACLWADRSCLRVSPRGVLVLYGELRPGRTGYVVAPVPAAATADALVAAAASAVAACPAHVRRRPS